MNLSHLLSQANFKVIFQLIRRMPSGATAGLKITYNSFIKSLWVNRCIPTVITTGVLLDRYIWKAVYVAFVSRRSGTVCRESVPMTGIAQRSWIY